MWFVTNQQVMALMWFLSFLLVVQDFMIQDLRGFILIPTYSHRRNKIVIHGNGSDAHKQSDEKVTTAINKTTI